MTPEDKERLEAVKGNVVPGLHTLMIAYATKASARIDEVIDLLRLSKEAYEKSAEAGKKERWTEMNRLRAEGTEFLYQSEKVWQNDNDQR